tara:strand:- start:1 stop:240 length:240 start_codon:yes stop_codon:yes gene_type:complete
LGARVKMSNGQDKYFLEINIECVLEIEAKKKEAIVDKINKLIHKILKGENAIHLNTNMNLISEKNLMYSLANVDFGEEN